MKNQRPAFLRGDEHIVASLRGDEDVVADVDHAHPACYPRPSVPNADDPETPRATEVPREAPRALVAARARIKALLDERTPVYESVATHVVDTDGRLPLEVAAEIQELLR